MGLMADPDRHLADFNYQTSKNGNVSIYWNNRLVKTLSNTEARQFVSRADQADEQTVQLLMAKATGNFKRGNERIIPKDYEKEDDNARSVSG